MHRAYFSQANVVGAFALNLGERVQSAVERACAMQGAPPVALVALHEFAGGDSIAMLSRVLGVSHSRAVRVIDQLEAKRWARRRADLHDGRALSVWLTRSGRRVAEHALDAREAAIADFLAPLRASDLQTLSALAAAALGEHAVSRDAARRICRLCDAGACGHSEGRCPVTQARLARGGQDRP
jgi:MarR family transcriptional regulator, negative regulator of the multidrug operon emrRAB